MTDASTDILFQLIKSMSQTEKRYFKCFSKQYLVGKKDRYVKLFDLINSQPKYNEVKLLKSIRDPQFKKNIVENKQYLYNQILKALRNYESTKSVYIQLEEALMNIEILFKKAIYDGALSLVNQSLKTAIKYEFLYIQIELKQYRRKIQLKTNAYKYCERLLDDAWEEDEKLLKKLEAVNDHIGKQANIFYDLYGSKGFNTKDSKEMDRYAVVLEKQSWTNFYTSNLYHQGEIIKGKAYGDLHQMYINVKALFILFKNQEHFTEIYLNQYITCCSNYIYVCEKMDKKEEGNLVVQTVSTKLERLSKKHIITAEKYLDCMGFIYAESFFLNLKVKNLEAMKRSYRFIKENALIEKNIEKARKYMLLLYVTGLAEFLFNWKEEAINTINKFNRFKHKHKAVDLDGSMRLLSILVNYEKGNVADLSNYRDETYFFLESKGMLGPIEKLFLNYFKKEASLTNRLEKEELIPKWRFMEAEIKRLEKEGIINLILRDFGVKIWLASKIQNCSVHYLLEKERED